MISEGLKSKIFLGGHAPRPQSSVLHTLYIVHLGTPTATISSTPPFMYSGFAPEPPHPNSSSYAPVTVIAAVIIKVSPVIFLIILTQLAN